MDAFLWLKVAHIVSIISWMAGQLYLYRLFVYHAAEEEQVVRDRFEVMERRLLRGIANPSAIFTLLTGGILLYLQPFHLKMPYMHAKLLFVFGLYVSHGLAAMYRKKLMKNPNALSSGYLRVLNEVPTLLMVAIVITIVVKPWAN